MLGVQAEVIRYGVVRSVDVPVRRGDGTTGHFAVTTKLRTDDDGRKIGIYGTIQDVTDRKTAAEQLEKLAFHDPLTGLANRTLFHRRIDDVLARSVRTGESGALLLLDLDRFKAVNDLYGHNAGDTLLVRVSECLTAEVGNLGMVSRMGGDEFVVILEGAADSEPVNRVLNSVTAIFRTPFDVGGMVCSVGASIGVSQADDPKLTAEEFLSQADVAMYRN